MERAGRVHVCCGKEEEAQALAAGECDQVAGFCFLGVGKEAGHFTREALSGEAAFCGVLRSCFWDRCSISV